MDNAEKIKHSDNLKSCNQILILFPKTTLNDKKLNRQQ